jgi:hypothetical protein
LLETNNVYFIIACDEDDITMNNNIIKNRLNEFNNLKYYFDKNKSKVEACNCNIQGNNFDVLLLASDDMIPNVYGYDAIIKNSMSQFYPDTDGVLWFNDGFQGSNLNTLSIIGKKYYDRFNYIYNPEYQSLYCDLEFTQVSRLLNKTTYIDKQIITHQQYSIIGETPDELYIKNDNLQHIDLITYQRRSKNNFK